MKFNYEDTQIPNLFALEVAEQTGKTIYIPEIHVSRVAKVILKSLMDYAAMMKSKERPVAVIIDDLKGNPLLSIIVRFHAGENKEPGNYSVECSMDPDDVKDCDKFMVSEPKAERFFTARGDEVHMTWRQSYIALSCQVFATTIRKFLDANAKVDEEVELVLDGYFTASVVVDADTKIFSIVLDGDMKRLVKSDATLEVF